MAAARRQAMNSARRGSSVSVWMNAVNAQPTSWSQTTDSRDAINTRVCDAAGFYRRCCVDKNRVEGTKHEVKGAVKEGVGKVTGNHMKEAAGNLEKNAGKLQKEVGKTVDEQRDVDKRRH
jgi:uncharacterized protein YjbJ (UPF0337 family)